MQSESVLAETMAQEHVESYATTINLPVKNDGKYKVVNIHTNKY
jgi:hypothetical protein